MKPILPILKLSLSMLLLTACGGTKESPEAVNLLDGAADAYNAGNTAEATMLLDSLQKTFPSEISVQRRAMSLRPKVIELAAHQEIASLDSMTSIDNQAIKDLRMQLRWVKTPGMIEGYYIYKPSYNSEFYNSTGIEARVNEIGQFYIVSSLNPSGKAHHTAISISNGTHSATTPNVPYDGESNYRIDGGEVITFSPEQSDTIGTFVAQSLSSNPSAKFTLSFAGNKVGKPIKLSSSQSKGIAVAYNYSYAIIRARENEIKRQKLIKTIEIARRQAAIAETPRQEE